MAKPYFKQTLLVTLIFVAVFPQAQSQVLDGVPHLINYQGRLTDTDGNPVTDGEYLITFTIWSDSISTSPADRKWIEPDCPIIVINGMFNWQLGSREPLPPWTMANNSALWLGIKVGADPELSPRTRVTSAPYAYKAWQAVYAKYADSAGTLAGNPPGSGWIDDGSVIRLETSADNVGIGTSSPGVKLDVNGDIWARSRLTVDNSIQVGDLIDATRIHTSQFRLTVGASTNYVLTSDGIGNGTWLAPSWLSGSGTIGYLSKFATSDSLGNSNLFDDGTNIGIGTTSPSAKLDVYGDTWLRSNLVVDNSVAVADLLDAGRIYVNQFRLTTGATTGYILTSDASGNATWQALNAITGPGVTGSIPKYSGANTLTNSVIVEAGNNIGIGISPSSSKLDVNGNVSIRGGLTVDNSIAVGDLVDATKVYVSQFRKTGGAVSGYVLTSDASGNGTWQPLPSSVNSDTIGLLELKINELINTVGAQHQQIEQLENRLRILEGSR